jgi:hypothetical protein
MYLPWIGIFEQLNLCDTFIHLDDVQFPQGRSFIHRVQLKTKDGIKWLSVPIDRKNSGKNINETLISYNENWREKHFTLIQQSFSTAPNKNLLFDLCEDIFSKKFDTISELNIYAFELISNYFGFNKTFIKSSTLGVSSKSSQRLIDILKQKNATTYITGLGALNYINYELFEDNNITLKYMEYKHYKYKQFFGQYTPYVSIVDLVANTNEVKKEFFNSKSIYWREFTNE